MGADSLIEKPRPDIDFSQSSKRNFDKSLVGFIAIVCGLGLLGPLLPPGALSLVIEMMILSVFAMGYDIVIGYTDQCSLGHSVFFGAGGYSVVFSIYYFNTGFWVALLVVLAVSAALAFFEGLITVRLSEAYFVIITAIFFSVFHLLALDFTGITGGDDGLCISVPPVSLGFGNVSLYNPLVNYYFVFLFLVATYILLNRLVHSPLGRVFICIRENETRARFLGYNTFRYKLAAFVLSGLFAGLSGALFALRLRYCSADSFGFTWSVNPLIWCLIGGMGTLVGPCIGVVIMSLFQYYMGAVWNHYLIIVGVLIILILKLSPKGIMGIAKKRGKKARESVST